MEEHPGLRKEDERKLWVVSKDSMGLAGTKSKNQRDSGRRCAGRACSKKVLNAGTGSLGIPCGEACGQVCMITQWEVPGWGRVRRPWHTWKMLI